MLCFSSFVQVDTMWTSFPWCSVFSRSPFVWIRNKQLLVEILNRGVLYCIEALVVFASCSGPSRTDDFEMVSMHTKSCGLLLSQLQTGNALASNILAFQFHMEITVPGALSSEIRTRTKNIRRASPCSVPQKTAAQPNSSCLYQTK